MIQMNNLDTILNSSTKKTRFSSIDQKSFEYQGTDMETNVCLFDGKIMEYDMDIDVKGYIGLILLTHDGKLLYYVYDGKKWNNYAIFHFNFLFEEIKNLRIRFSNQTPIITFCSRTQSQTNQWTLNTFMKVDNHWKRDVLTKIYIQAAVTPYTIIKDKKDNIYLFTLNNHNIVYDLNLYVFQQQSQSWSPSVFISNCIFVKYFHLDALIDPNGGIHVLWIDKYKKNYCIKYTYRPSLKGGHINPSVIMESSEPFVWNHLYMSQNTLHAFGFSKDRIYKTGKPLTSTFGPTKWQRSTEIEIQMDQLRLYKFLGSSRNYRTNFVLSSSDEDYQHISIDDVESSPQQNFIKETNQVPSEFNAAFISKRQQEFPNKPTDERDDSLRYKSELFKKSQQLEINQGLFKSIQSEVTFLKEEIKILHEQHKRNIQFLNDVNDKYRKINESIGLLTEKIENKLHENNSMEIKRNLENLTKEIQKNKLDIIECQALNAELKETLVSLQQAGLFRKIFG